MSCATGHPRTVAIIPARGGSKGVPGKNLRPVDGVPLVVRAIRSCLAAESVDAVYVSTDDRDIAAAARKAGSEVIWRPAALADDLASSEAALLHGLEELAEQGLEPSVLLFVQCTSPFLDPADLDTGVRLVLEAQADSAFSAVATYEFLWRDVDPTSAPGAGAVAGVNHDAAVRPRRQDRRPDFRETGGFYALAVPGFRASKHRFFGRTAVVPVSELTTLEVDTPADLLLAEALVAIAGRPSVGLPALDAVITDFDGVHTADTAYVDQMGREAVRVSRSDGLGIAQAKAAGVELLILSKERNPVVAARAAKLGVEVLQAVDDKAPAVLAWLAAHQIAPERAAYVGNDVNDLPAMRVVGWPVAVADARPEVLAAARLRLTRPGGRGAVRELCDLVVAARAPSAADDASTPTAPSTPGPAAEDGAVDAPGLRLSRPA
ncbi:MAG TPA: acylneuraminate cytidylyltransferase [Propionibacteriaceae bacterium]|nr:acylneuraminate cytidylyltransferase [Propionibacteriaceae bacterium]